MDLNDAYAKVAMAGRELGSGPSRAASYIAPGDTLANLRWKGISDANIYQIRLGIAIGLVMAEDPKALATLAEIEKEWREEG